MNRKRGVRYIALALMLCCQFLVGTAWPAVLSSEEVSRACASYVLDRTGYRQDEIIFSLLREIPQLSLPQGETALVVSGDVEKGETGKIALTVNVVVDDVPYRNIYVLCRLDVKEVAYVTTRWIRRGEILSPDDVSVIEVVRSELPPRAISDEKQFRGLVAKVSLPEGRILTDMHFERPALVKRKQPVIMMAEKGGVKIEAKGIALQDGCRGEVIKIKNSDSGKVVYGEVIDENRVAVNIP